MTRRSGQEVDMACFAVVKTRSTWAWSIWRMTELNLAIKACRLLLLPILIVKRVASLTFSQVDPWYLSMNSFDSS